MSAKVYQLPMFFFAYLQVCQLSIFLAAYLGVPGKGVCQLTGKNVYCTNYFRLYLRKDKA